MDKGYAYITGIQGKSCISGRGDTAGFAGIQSFSPGVLLPFIVKDI